MLNETDYLIIAVLLIVLIFLLTTKFKKGKTKQKQNFMGKEKQ